MERWSLFLTGLLFEPVDHADRVPCSRMTHVFKASDTMKPLCLSNVMRTCEPHPYALFIALPRQAHLRDPIDGSRTSRNCGRWGCNPSPLVRCGLKCVKAFGQGDGPPPRSRVGSGTERAGRGAGIGCPVVKTYIYMQVQTLTGGACASAVHIGL